MSKSINLNPKEIEVLEVNLGDKVYKIPLGSSLTQKELKGLNKNENAEKFFIKYLGKEVWESLTLVQMKALMEAWSEATEEACGVSLGKS